MALPKVYPGFPIGATVGTSELEAGAVTSTKLASDSVGWGNLISSLRSQETYAAISYSDLAAPAASVSFSSISSAYKALKLFMRVKSDTAAFEDVRIRFNADSGDNYQNYSILNTAGVVSAVDSSSGSTYLIYPNLDNNTAGAFTEIMLHISNINGKWKFIRADTALVPTLSRTVCFSGVWKSTSQISSISIAKGSNNFETGSFFQLFGTGDTD